MKPCACRSSSAASLWISKGPVPICPCSGKRNRQSLRSSRQCSLLCLRPCPCPSLKSVQLRCLRTPTRKAWRLAMLKCVRYFNDGGIGGLPLMFPRRSGKAGCKWRAGSRSSGKAGVTLAGRSAWSSWAFPSCPERQTAPSALLSRVLRCCTKLAMNERPEAARSAARQAKRTGGRARSARPNLFIVNFGTQRVTATWRVTGS